MRFLRELFRLGGVVDPVTADEARALQDFAERRPVQMDERQYKVEMPMALGLALVATGLALADHSHLRPGVALVLIVALAIVQRVDFEVGSGYTVPTQLVFVPMLFLLPAGVIPSAVAIAMVIDRLPDVLRGRVHQERLVVSVSDAWFSVGPALVFLIANAGPPSAGDWPLYLTALVAQFVFDGAASWVRAGAGLGNDVIAHVRELRIVWTVDALLAPIGLLAATTATTWGVMGFLLVVPLAVLLRVFAGERHARLAQALELSSAYRRVALLLGDLIGDDDEYTGAHSKGVVGLSIAIADELEVGPEERYLVEFGALLHDVGKIAIPKAIINKPGELDDAEWAIMKTHTIEGQRMLDQVGGSLQGVGLVVRASHEAWDGGGYPDGLVAEQIPLAARIVACADAFSAMTTNRSYRAAMSCDVAIAELRRCSGTQFDPRVADAVIAVVSRPGGADSPDSATAGELAELSVVAEGQSVSV
jgi:putative nucleotidyltransferase with HDIG domain